MSAPASCRTPSRPFGVLVPVKPAAVAKSRLQPLGDDVRQALVNAFAVDTVAAAAACPAVARVLVVTDDLALASALRERGIDAVPDGESLSLNASLQQGAAELLRRAPGLRPVALCADLPALRPAELAVALAAAARPDRAFVPDASGGGTTMYAAASLELFAPRFGPGSRASHASQGATEILVGDIESLRRDVDTPADLRAAAALGLGPRTALAISSRGLLQ